MSFLYIGTVFGQFDLVSHNYDTLHQSNDLSPNYEILLFYFIPFLSFLSPPVRNVPPHMNV